MSSTCFLCRNRLAAALLAITWAAAAHAAVIGAPDTDPFSAAGTPPAGWRVDLAPTSGAWSSDGSVLTAGVKVYNPTSLIRGSSSADGYQYDSTKPLVIQVDMNPALGQETSSAGVEFLTDKSVNSMRFSANGGQGYFLRATNSGSNMALQLWRDPGQWDVTGTIVASTVLAATYRTTMHTYRIEMSAAVGTSVDFSVYLDGGATPVLQYTDPQFMPLAGYTQKPGGYTDWIAGFVNYQWPNSGATQFDNWLVDVPEPATMGLLGLGFAGLAILRRRRA